MFIVIDTVNNRKLNVRYFNIYIPNFQEIKWDYNTMFDFLYSV